MNARVFIVPVLLAMASLASASDAFAAGFSNIDIGARRMGMFSVMGRPDDVTAVFHNPAGLTLLEGTHLYHSQSWFFVELGLRMYDSQGYLHPEHELSPDWNVGFLPFLGAASDLGTKDFRLGFGIYAPNAYGAAMPDDEPSRYHVTRALFLASRATLSAAYRVTPQFSVGASVHLIYVYLKAKRILNVLVLQDPDRRFDDPKTTSTHELDSTLNLDGQDWTWGWDVGVLFTPLDTFRIGASFASGSAIGLDGDVKLTYPDGKVERARQHTGLAIPLTLRVGFNWELAPDFQVAADMYWWHYQVMQEQRTTLSKPIAGIREFVDPKNYGNCWQWNAGLSYRLHPRLELSAGFQMDGSPIPSATYTLDNPTTKQYGVGLGGRWQVTDRVRLGFAIVRNWFQLLDVQDNVQNPPSNVKGHGSNFEFGFDVDWRI